MLRVVADAVYFLRGNVAAPSRELTYRDSILPVDILPSSAAFLLGAGFVAEVPDMATDPSPAPSPTVPAAELMALAAQVASAQTAAQQATSMAQSVMSTTDTQAGEIATLAQVAATAQTAITSSASDRQSLRAWLVSLQQQVDTILLTPGPRGLPGDDGRDATDQQVSTAVAAWLAAHPPPSGIDGKSVELRVTGSTIEWRQTGATWAALTSLSTLKGDPGTNGLSAYQQWQAAGNSGTQAQFLASLVGTPGASVTGPAGPGAEMRVSNGLVQWRQVGAASWTDLYTVPATPTSRTAPGVIALALLLNASTPVTVKWPTAMPSATYSIECAPGVGLAASTAFAVQSQTKDDAVVRVTATGLAIAAGSWFLATARTT